MRGKLKSWCQGLGVGSILLGMFALAPNDHAAAAGNILDYATVPSNSEIASSKYAVIAQFNSNSRLIFSGATTYKSNSGNDFVVEPSSSKKGAIKALYTNVATFKGKSLDFELVVEDWKEAGYKGGEFFTFASNTIGFSQGGYDYVSLKGTYKYSETGRAATDLTGSYMTVNDFDANQYMSFDSGMMSKIEKMYAYPNSLVSYWKANGKTNIGARFNEAIDSDDERGIVTMLVSGYEFDFEWRKDWSKPASTGKNYNFDQVLDWRDGDSAQYFGYIAEKPVRTETLIPTKQIIDNNGNPVDSNKVTPPDSFTYEVYHTVPAEYPRFFYNSYVMQDEIHKAFSIDRVRIYDSVDRDVTSRFNVSTNGQTVKATATNSSLSSKSFYGQDYRFVIKVSAQLSSAYLDFASGSDRFTAPNTATVTIDGRKKSSNEVKTTVMLPKLELSMQKIQIYTNKASAGLPLWLTIKVGADSTVEEEEEEDELKEKVYKDDRVTIAIYAKNGGSRTRVASKTVKVKDLSESETFRMPVPSSTLHKDDKRNYEAVFEDYDANHIVISRGGERIDTDGYTAKEGIITNEEVFEGTVMTERTLGDAMKSYTETLKSAYQVTKSLKTGYAIELTANVKYTNKKMNDVASNISLTRVTDSVAKTDYPLVDTSLSYYGSGNHYSSGDTINIPLLRKKETTATTSSEVEYQLPHVNLEHPSGFTFTDKQKADGLLKGKAIDGGNKIYVPVWLDRLGVYGMAFQTSKPIGSHFMEIKIPRSIDVYAYMFHHTDSKTPDQDELLIHPWVKGGTKEEW